MARRISTLDAHSRATRRPRRQPQRPVILVVCEGQTEVAYFRAFKAHYGRSITVNVKIVRDQSDPVRVVERGIRDNKRDNFDRVFCVVDGDKPDRTAEARERIGKRKNIDLIVSIPCFEVWLLLHFASSDAPFDACAAVCARLMKEHIPGYGKGGYDFASITPRIGAAIENAKWLADRNLANPATDVHKVLTYMMSPAP